MLATKLPRLQPTVKRRIVVPTAIGAFGIIGLFLAVRCAAWWGQPEGDAWIVDRSEQVLSGLSSGKEVEVLFRLKNVAHRPLRVLGGLAC